MIVLVMLEYFSFSKELCNMFFRVVWIVNKVVRVGAML